MVHHPPRGAVSHATRNDLGQQVLCAGDFLDWAQQQKLTLTTLRQNDLVRWLIDHRPHQRQLLKPCLAWAARAGHMPRLAVITTRGG
ncbi:hypothetical protein [Micromonospora sp. NPDC004704]